MPHHDGHRHSQNGSMLAYQRESLKFQDTRDSVNTRKTENWTIGKYMRLIL